MKLHTQTEWVSPAETASVAPLRVRLQERLVVVQRDLAKAEAEFDSLPIDNQGDTVDDRPDMDAAYAKTHAIENEETALLSAIIECQRTEIMGLTAPIIEIPSWTTELAKERLKSAKEASEQAKDEAAERDLNAIFEPEPPPKPKPGVDCPFPIPACKRGESIFYIQARPNSMNATSPYTWEPVAAKLIPFAEHSERQFIVYRYVWPNGYREDWSLADVKTGRLIANRCPTRAQVIDKAHKLFTDHPAAKWRKIFAEAEAKLKDLPPKPRV